MIIPALVHLVHYKELFCTVMSLTVLLLTVLTLIVNAPECALRCYLTPVKLPFLT